MAHSKTTKTEREMTNAVMFMIDAHKPEIVDALFAPCSDDYRAEWYRRDVFAFWCHLDNGNRSRLIALAKDHYAVGQDDPERAAEKAEASVAFFRAEAARLRRELADLVEAVESERPYRQIGLGSARAALASTKADS
jgi:hypothetical protein